MKSVTRQMKEDYLEAMYMLKRRKNQILKADLSKHLAVPMYQVNRVTDELTEEGYLRRSENRHLYLTTIGLNKGREYLERHRCLTEFLRRVSGVNKELAEDNACRIEHILDEEVYLGIRVFMENRHTYAYTMEGNDLSFLFPHGERWMPVAIYVKGSAHPRILAPEYRMFQNKAKVLVNEETYIYLLPADGDRKPSDVYYFYDNRWIPARREQGGYGIISEALKCCLRRNVNLEDGKIPIVVTEKGEEPDPEQARILEITLI